MIEGLGAVHAYRAQVTDVESDRRGAAGPMLGHRPRRIRQRHVPAAERDHLGAESDVRRVQRGDPERRCVAVVGVHVARLGRSRKQAV